MTWVVDTCIILDVLQADPQFGEASADLLEELLKEGLTVSPVTMVELGVAFAGDMNSQKKFLDDAGIAFGESWTAADTEAAHSAWQLYVTAKRLGQAPKRPIADVLIGGFAANRTGLVTRNSADFRRWFPNLAVRVPDFQIGTPPGVANGETGQKTDRPKNPP